MDVQDNYGGNTPTVDLEEYRKAVGQKPATSGYIAPYYPQPHPCPSCGRCPTCGRGNYWPVYPTQPGITWTVPMIYPNGTTVVCNSNL